jgi:predicted RND superfamily exporter protein
MDKVNELFPIMIATTVGVVFLVVAVIFKSVFVPIRLLVTIALGICWCAFAFASLALCVRLINKNA